MVHAKLTFSSKVKETSGQKGKTKFANLKRVVWHLAFKRILKRLCKIAVAGYYFKFPNGAIYRLFPFLLILSADYEEQ